ncbi:MAG: 23S rRNA (cytidine(2498)-2'-O)-methyltransferase RlmM [Pseudomonadota bacterium]
MSNLNDEACFVCFCRSGYEPDLAAECEYHLATRNGYGYAKYEKGSGCIAFYTPTPALMPKLKELVFARQKLSFLTTLSFHDASDRITPILEFLHSLNSMEFGNVIVEHADNEQAKTLAKFCKKFTVPLRAALRKNVLQTRVQQDDKSWLHVIFDSFDGCRLCFSTANDRSPYAQGILRLKFPASAPSRSTLKLEEALHVFFNKESEKRLFNENMSAVDLGACPGGWTYQLVKRNMRVEAIDNGDIATTLMDTGLVMHAKADGFTYRPVSGHVDWLVCDMIENPYRVAELVAQWIQQGWAKASIFNLKLPMKRRFETVKEILSALRNKMRDKSGTIIEAKHLYHDRDEITVLVLPMGDFDESTQNCIKKM